MTYKEKIISAGLDEERPIAGLSDEEIAEVEKSQGVKLPASYLAFLIECGKGAGLFERDADFFYPAIKNLKSELREMLKEEGIKHHLPDDIFVFSAYQGYQYCYFLCDGNGDPEIYRITDGGNEPIMVSCSFTEHIEKAIESYRRTFFQN